MSRDLIKPERLTLSRKRGFNLQELPKTTKGLEAVAVARPSSWGNPYPLEAYGRERFVALYAEALAEKRG